MHRFLSAAAVFLATLAFTTPACDERTRPRVGSSCSYDQECESGVCGGNVCLDAELDSDLDGLTNGTEAAVRSNPLHPDSDGDGLDDRVEYGEGAAPIDTDGDGLPDLIESLLADADGDCIPDQLDARNLEPDTDLDYLVATVCSDRGVCAAATAPTAVCRTDTADNPPTPVCDYGALDDFEPTEVACDGLDNDCDGTTDEGHPDTDNDGLADCIDSDRDGDDVANDADNCPDVANADQEDTDGDGSGDLCDRPSEPTFVGIEPGPSGRDAVPRLTGSAEPNHIVHVFVDDPECLGPPRIATTASANAAFNGGVPVFAGRRSTFSAIARNRGGLQSECVEAPFDYTHLADAAPRPTPPQPLATQPVEILTDTNIVTIRLCVLPELVAHAHVIVAGATGNAAACVAPPAANTFSMELDPDGICPPDFVPMIADVPLPDSGEFIIRATTTTADGLTSECTDVTRVGHYPDPPSAPTLVAVNPPSPSNDPTLTVRVAAERLVRIELFVNAACNEAPAAEGHVPSPPPPNGIALPLTVATDATTDVSARAIDRLGRTSPCATLFQHQHVSGQRPPAPYPHPRIPFDPPSPTRLAPDAVSVRVCTSAAGVSPTLYAANHCGAVGPAPIIGTLGAATSDAECPSGFAATGTLALAAESVTPLAADFTVAGGVRSWCGFLGTFDHHTTPPAPLTSVAFAPESPSSDPSPRITAVTDPHAAVAIFADAACDGPVIGRTVATATGFVSTALSLPLRGMNLLYARVTDGAGNATDCHAIGLYELDIVEIQPPIAIEPSESRPTTNTTAVGVVVCALRDRTTLLHIDRTANGLACADSAAIAMTPTTGPSCPSDMAPFTTTLRLADGTLNSNNLTRISAQTLPGPLETASQCRVLADITHDDIPPAPPVRTGFPPISPTPDPRPAIAGTGESRAALRFFADPACAASATTPATVVGEDGTWRTAFHLTSNATTSLYGRLQDAAGNTSTCNLLATITHDDVPPPNLLLAVGIGSPTSNPAPTLTWCGEPGSRVTFHRSSGCRAPFGEERVINDTYPACVGATGGALTASIAAFLNQDNTIYAETRDAAGNRSPCTVATSFFHDDMAPAPPIVESPRPVSWNAGFVAFETHGKAEPNSRVTAWRVTTGATLPTDVPCEGDLVGSADADAVGNFAISMSVPHGEPVSVAWTARDRAGNISPCAGPVDVVGPASARLEGLAAYQTTPGLSAGTIAFHRPDGEVYATRVVADEMTTASAMVFDGCLIANYWQSNGFPDRNADNQPPPNEVLHGIDTVHAQPGDDIVFRLRRQPGPYQAPSGTTFERVSGTFAFGFPSGSFGGGLNFEVKWEGCDNFDAYSHYLRPSWPLQAVQCSLERCTGTLSEIDLACLAQTCELDPGTGDPCGLTRFSGRARVVGTMFNGASYVEPMGFTEVLDIAFAGRRDFFMNAGPFNHTNWTECSGDCPGLTYRRGELPLVLSVPATPTPREFVWFQRCRQRRDPRNDELQRATGHIRVDTTCSSRRTCIEGAEPNCTRWRAEDGILVFPVPDTFPLDVFPDPHGAEGLDAHAVLSVAWEEGDWHTLSATIDAWDFDSSDLVWTRRWQPLDPTFDGAAVHATWPIVNLAFECDEDALFISDPGGPNNRRGSLDSRCTANRTCVASEGADCVRWRYASRVVALAWNIDPATLGEYANRDVVGPPDAWTDPIDIVWHSDDWRVAVPFGPWRSDFRNLDMQITNNRNHWTSGTFGATNFFGGRPLQFPSSQDGGLGGAAQTALAPGAGANDNGRVFPDFGMPWATMAVVTDFLLGESPIVGQSVHFAGAQVPPADGTQVAVDIPSRLVSIHWASMLLGLDVLADPNAAHRWRVETMANGGAPLDAVIVHTSIGTSSSQRYGGTTPQRRWFWTHVMPPEGTEHVITRPRPPVALDAWRVPYGDPDIDILRGHTSVTVTTANLAGGDFSRFKSEWLSEVPTFSSIIGLSQEIHDGGPLPFVTRTTSGATFDAGLSFGVILTK